MIDALENHFLLCEQNAQRAGKADAGRIASVARHWLADLRAFIENKSEHDEGEALLRKLVGIVQAFAASENYSSASLIMKALARGEFSHRGNVAKKRKAAKLAAREGRALAKIPRKSERAKIELLQARQRAKKKRITATSSIRERLKKARDTAPVLAAPVYGSHCLEADLCHSLPPSTQRNRAHPAEVK
jgi:hypothetical protein